MRRHLSTTLLIILAINTGWFVLYSAALGWRGLTTEAAEDVSRVFIAGTPWANAVLAVHMLAGALLTFGAPLQATPLVRRRWPGQHRRAGRILVALAVVTGSAGLFYIARNGTVGGAWMSLWFGIYGAAVIVAGAMTFHHALRRDFTRHFEWATRLVILAVGSWIYRMHYALWYGVTGGAGSNPQFSGPFDQVQVVAFFVPYLLIAEFFLRRARMRRSAV